MSTREPAPWFVKYDGPCARCGTVLRRGDVAIWDRAARTMHCVECPTEPAAADRVELDSGRGGVSAQREYERRMAKRDAAAREKWGQRVGGVVLRLTEPPATTRAWASGADGEAKVAQLLDRIDGVRALHDRRVPGSTGNIDHLVVAPSGIFIVDAKNHAGMVRIRDRGGFFRTDLRLYVGSRDCSMLADGLAWQIEAVTIALRGAEPQPPITPVLCFARADWPLIRPPSEFRAVRLESLASLRRLLERPGPRELPAIDHLTRALASALPSR